MTQGILVIILFIAASFYLGKTLYKAFTGKGDHCGNCTVRDQQVKS